jgi:hypothetical protein
MLVVELVVAGDGFAVRALAGDGGDQPRLGDVLADPERFPLGVAGLVAQCGERMGFCGRDLVVGHRHATAPPAVLSVESCRRMGCGTRSSEEVENQCVGVLADEQSQGLLDRI